MPSAMCSASEQLVCSALVQETNNDGQKSQSLPLLQPCYRFYAQFKVAEAKRAQLFCAAHAALEKLR